MWYCQMTYAWRNSPSLLLFGHVSFSNAPPCVLGLKQTFLLHYTCRYSVISVTSCKCGRRWLSSSTGSLVQSIFFYCSLVDERTVYVSLFLFSFTTPELVIDRETLEIPTVLPFWKPNNGFPRPREGSERARQKGSRCQGLCTSWFYISHDADLSEVYIQSPKTITLLHCVLSSRQTVDLTYRWKWT